LNKSIQSFQLSKFQKHLFGHHHFSIVMY